MGKTSTSSTSPAARIGHDLIARPDFVFMQKSKKPEVHALTGARRRLTFVFTFFIVVFCVVGGRLTALGFASSGEKAVAVLSKPVPSGSRARPDIVDRNGEIMATDIMTASLYANPAKVRTISGAAKKIVHILPELDLDTLEKRLSSGKSFVWLKRDLTPRQHNAIHNLGLPGIGFRREMKRVYPNGRMAAHVLGYVGAERHGLAGMERYLDRHRRQEVGLEGRIALSLDMRVQHALTDEIARAVKTFRAKGGVGIIMDMQTGEVIALASLPDFDPNAPMNARESARFNRATLGVYEMGSTFKAFTTAAVLESGKVSLVDQYDAREPIQIARFTIDDTHAQRRWLSVPEIFIHSSNIGTVRMVTDLGPEPHRLFLEHLGLLTGVRTELPEQGRPLLPDRWTDISMATVSYGHGISVTPLQVVRAGAVLMNGGYEVTPTFLRQSRTGPRERIVSEKTSLALQALMRLVVKKGTGRQADVPGYPVIGKTGTAEKVIGGRYSSHALITSFLSAFPANNPRYAALVMLDEPKGTKETFGYASAGWNAAPLTARIVRRVAPLLALQPVFGEHSSVRKASLRASE